MRITLGGMRFCVYSWSFVSVLLQYDLQRCTDCCLILHLFNSSCMPHAEKCCFTSMVCVIILWNIFCCLILNGWINGSLKNYCILNVYWRCGGWVCCLTCITVMTNDRRFACRSCGTCMNIITSGLVPSLIAHTLFRATHLLSKF